MAIHGDFSADQVILHDGIPVLIDWDQMAAGDPGQDLGSFLARLDAQAIEGALSAEAAGAAGAALCEGYALGAALPANLTPHRARGLVLLATEGFRRRDPDWPRRTERLLARAEALLAEQRRPPAQGTDLPMLAQALDEGAIRPLLAAALGVAPEALDLRPPQLVREKPGRRALVRYRGAAGDAPFDLLGKLRAKGPDIRTAALHRALRLRGLDGRAPGATGVPASRGRIDVLHLWLQERAPGLTATEFLRPDAPTEAATQTGAALAQLHRADVATARGWSLADESAVLDRALGAAAAEQPREAPRLAAIAGRARALLARLEPVRPTGIHRDFHPDQVLIDGPQVWIVDLDLYASGDPAIDLGNYLAHIAELALRRHGAPDALAAHEAAFLGGYRQILPEIDICRVAVLRIVSLARHIQISTRFADRRHATAGLIGAVEAALDAGAADAASISAARRDAR